MKRTLVGPKHVKLMLDSGAYTAWRKRVQIDLDDYCSFVLANRHSIDSCVALDVIPGTWGCNADESAEQSWANLKYMRERGIHPVPVFHQGESIYHLERILGEGYTWIGISPDNNKGTSAKRKWLDQVFPYIPTSIRTHAFGMTQVELLFRYPWYSCDSMTWMIAAANGGVLVPAQEWPKLHLQEPFLVILVTDGTRRQSRHYNRLNEKDEFACCRYWNWVTGFNMDQLRKCHLIRMAANLRICSSVERHLIRHHQNQFGRWIYATNDSPDYSALLSGILMSSEVLPYLNYDDDWFETPDGYLYGYPYGHFQQNRLLSYWYIKNKDPQFLRRYVATGLMEDFDITDKLGQPFQPKADERRSQVTAAAR